MENIEKTITKHYFGCAKCSKKMDSISVGGSSTDFLGFSSGKTNLMYCDNKECEKYGYLTVAGIKKEE